MHRKIIDIKGYENKYSISDDGEVWSYYKQEYMKPNLGGYGYKQIQLAKNGKRKTYQIHKLVLEHFTEKVSGKEFCNHKNGDKHDNRIENLEWCTISENNKHAYRTGLKGKSVGNPKYLIEQIKAAKYLLHTSMTGKEIAKATGMSESCVSLIKRNERWCDIEINCPCNMCK